MRFDLVTRMMKAWREGDRKMKDDEIRVDLFYYINEIQGAINNIARLLNVSKVSDTLQYADTYSKTSSNTPNCVHYPDDSCPTPEEDCMGCDNYIRREEARE